MHCFLLSQPHHQCPFMEATSHEWIYMGPVFLLLTTNAFFLVSIFWVVVTKLRSNGSTSETTDHQVISNHNPQTLTQSFECHSQPSRTKI